MVEMDRLEKLFVHSPVVTWLHRDKLLPRMLRLARRPVEGPLLELGAGPGATTEGLLQRLPGVGITATDYDPEEVRRAERRLGARARVERADATRLPYADASFGTVVEMNTFHHIPDWRVAMGEAHRVLRPGGQFLFTDYTRRFAGGFFATPRYQPGLFTAEEFAEGLAHAGFHPVLVQGDWIIRGRAEKPRGG